MKKVLKDLAERIGSISNRELRAHVSSELYDIKAKALLPDLGVGYLPWSSYALRPGAVTLVLNEIVLNRSRTIIECGIGVSTLYILGSSLSDDVRLVGIEDDKEWIETIESYLVKMGVPKSRFCLIHAPIVDYDKSRGGGKWYDMEQVTTNIGSYLGEKKADMLLVDGPKANLGPMSRYKALPQLQRFLIGDYSVFLDDIHRNEELEIAKLWADEFGLKVSYHREKASMAVLRPGGTEKQRQILN